MNSDKGFICKINYNFIIRHPGPRMCPVNSSTGVKPSDSFRHLPLDRYEFIKYFQELFMVPVRSCDNEII